MIVGEICNKWNLSLFENKAAKMKKSISHSIRKINQKTLMEMLGLPSSVIRYLKSENILKCEKVGRQHFFDEESVKKFQQFFNRDDYLTVGECAKKLQRWKFYTFKIRGYNMFMSNLKIYITVTKLIEGGDDIPNEYQLRGEKFGNTQYIKKTSFAKTLNWLRNVNHKVNPTVKEDFKLLTNISKKKKNKKRLIGKLKTIAPKKLSEELIMRVG